MVKNSPGDRIEWVIKDTKKEDRDLLYEIKKVMTVRLYLF